MMTEQQTVLKSDDLKEKWNTCILATCYAYRTVDIIKEVVDDLFDVFRVLVNALSEVFKPVIETLSFSINKVIHFLSKEDFHEDSKSYPQSYPQYVDNFKVNTKGFTRPIVHCARSRC